MINIVKKLENLLLSASIKAGYNVEKSVVKVEKNQKITFGDYSSTIALQLAKNLNDNSMNIAKKIIAELKRDNLISQINIISPGFINFKVNLNYFYHSLKKVFSEKSSFGKMPNKSIHFNIEFVSVNPTGLLHVGHARNAAIGDSLANILQFQGYKVTREYYVNDAGNQIDILANSVFIRYQNLFNKNLTLPTESYQSEDLILVAIAIKNQCNDKFLNQEFVKVKGFFREFSTNFMLKQIKNDLFDFGVKIDIWFSELSLYKNHEIDKVLTKLMSNDYSYNKDNALWLKTTKFGDDKDRVLIKSDGSYTYMLPDLAYHSIKYQHSDLLINVWGADHYGYIQRIKAGLEALNCDSNKLSILCTQMVRLINNGQEQKMSKRAGTVVNIKDLIATIGKDAARFFMVSRTAESHLDIDVNIANKKDNNNPVFYIQYAHARINQLFANVENYTLPDNISLLTTSIERELLIEIEDFGNVLEKITAKLEPHLLTNYLKRLAKLFHSFYNECKINNINNKELTNQRLALVLAIKRIINNGLKLIGVSAPEQM